MVHPVLEWIMPLCFLDLIYNYFQLATKGWSKLKLNVTKN